MAEHPEVFILCDHARPRQLSSGHQRRASDPKAFSRSSRTISRLPTAHSQRIGWHKESNWVQTWPGKGYNVMLRLYGRLEPWFDKTWRPGEIEELKQLLPKSQFVTG